MEIESTANELQYGENSLKLFIEIFSGAPIYANQKLNKGIRLAGILSKLQTYRKNNKFIYFFYSYISRIETFQNEFLNMQHLNLVN